MITYKINFKDWKISIKDEITTANERIGEDFMSAFEWGYHEKRYEAELKLQYLSFFKNDTPLEEFIKQIEKELFNRLPLQTSTSASSNRADILRINALDYLRKNAIWYST